MGRQNYLKSKKTVVDEPIRMLDGGQLDDQEEYEIKGGEMGGTMITVIIVIIIAVVGYFVYTTFFKQSGFYFITKSPIAPKTPNRSDLIADRPIPSVNHTVGCAFEKNNAVCNPLEDIFKENVDVNFRNLIDAQQNKIFRELQEPVGKMVVDNSGTAVSDSLSSTNQPLYDEIWKDYTQGDDILQNPLYKDSGLIPSPIANGIQNKIY